MKRGTFKRLMEYGLHHDVVGKRALVSYTHDEQGLTIYGTLHERTPTSITIGNFVDISFMHDYEERLRRLISHEDIQREIGFLEELHKMRTKADPLTFDISKGLECYIVDTI